MNTAKLLATTLSAVAVAGAIGLAYAQTSTDGTASSTATQPVDSNAQNAQDAQNSSGTMNDRRTTSTMDNRTPGTMDSTTASPSTDNSSSSISTGTNNSNSNSTGNWSTDGTMRAAQADRN